MNLLAPLAQIAATQCGTGESPRGSNCGEALGKYFAADDYHPTGKDEGYAWCACYVSWCVQQFLRTAPACFAHVAPPRRADAFGFKAWGQQVGARILTPAMCSPGKDWPQIGDIAVYNFSHVGIVSAVSLQGDRIFTAVEGNSNDDGSREGYKVVRHGRKFSDVREFVRLTPRALAVCLFFAFFAVFNFTASADVVGIGETSSPALQMVLGRTVQAAATLAALSESDVSVVKVAAVVVAISAILAFIRIESKKQDPPAKRDVSGNISVQTPPTHIERHEHDKLAKDTKDGFDAIWEVIKGLRANLARIMADLAALSAQRNANGERLTELAADVKLLAPLPAQMRTEGEHVATLSEDIKGLSATVNRLVGLIEAQALNASKK